MLRLRSRELKAVALSREVVTDRSLKPIALRGKARLGVILLPTTDREHVVFRVLAVTAGVCEELLIRRYLLWYLATFVGPWPALLLGAVAFGLAHSYQGRSGIVKTGVVGLVMGVLYYATGSLLWPMIIHAAIDLQGGAVGRLLTRSRPEPVEQPVPATV